MFDTFQMHMKILEFLPQIHIGDLDELLSTSRQIRQMETLLAQLSDFESVSKEL